MQVVNRAPRDALAIEADGSQRSRGQEPVRSYLARVFEGTTKLAHERQHASGKVFKHWKDEDVPDGMLIP